MKRKLREPMRKPSRAAPGTGPGDPTRRLAQAEPAPSSVEPGGFAAIPDPATARAIPPHQAQEALRASEARLRRGELASKSGNWELHLDSQIVNASYGATKLYGVDKDRFDYAVIKNFPLPEYRPLLDAALRHLIENDETYDVEFKIKTADTGEIKDIHSIAAFNPEKRILFGIIQDITERKRADQLLTLEHTVARCLADADNASGGLKAVIRTVCETQNWERGSYWRADETAGVLRFDEFWNVAGAEFEGYTEGSRNVVFAPGVGVAGRVWQSGEPLWVADPGNDPRVLRKALAREASMFVFPVFSEGKTIGVLAFFSREARAPDTRLLAATRVIGSQVGQFLQRKQAEEALRESEARYRALTELSTDWYWEQDANLRFTYLSKPNAGQTEIAPDTFLGKTRREAPGIRWDESELAALEAIMEARRPFRDIEIGRTYLNGPKQYVQMSGEPKLDASGRFAGYRGVGKNVSERRRRDEGLRMFRAAMDATDDQIYLVDRASMRFIDVNDAACRTQSRSRDELLALGPGGVLSTSREELERVYDSVIAGGAATEPLEMLRRRKHGSQAWVELRRSAVRSGEGWMIVTVVRDITAHKQAEETIRYRAVQQSLIASFGQQALASVHLDDLLAQAVVVATEGLHVGLCRILLLAPDRQSLILKAGSGWEAGWIGRSITEVDAGTQNRFVLDAGEPVVVEDLARETRFAPSEILAAHGIRSGVDVPIGGAGGWFGILGVYAPEQRGFAPDSVNFLRSVANIIQTAVERKGAEEKLAYLAQFDTVTGLPNRNLFLDRLAQMLTQAQRNSWLAGVMFVDLDRFKAVNDTYGHGVGDKLLRLVAERLEECVRAGDTVGRLGGDEFAIALSTLGKADDASLVAQKVVDALARPFDLDGHINYMTASLGVALYPSDGADADGLLKNADIAMYRAKEHGRNTYRFYLPQMNERAEQRLRMETQLRGALERNEFVVHYQPKVNLTSGEISGFETLLRWQHPERGLVPPLDFISILEDTGLIVPVGEWVVRTACEQLRRWHAEGVTARPIAVNLSARQFQQKDLDAVIGRILRDTGADPFLLEFELTESLLMHDPEDAVRTLKKMKSYGVRLSVDDFGTGYSSLAYLKRFPLDALKIDHAFIRDVTTDPDDATIALTIINLAHSLRLKVVAEGVETEAQLDFLRAHDCDEMQGHFFAQPLPVADCTRMLIEDRHLQSPPT